MSKQLLKNTLCLGNWSSLCCGQGQTSSDQVDLEADGEGGGGEVPKQGGLRHPDLDLRYTRVCVCQTKLSIRCCMAYDNCVFLMTTVFVWCQLCLSDDSYVCLMTAVFVWWQLCLYDDSCVFLMTAVFVWWQVCLSDDSCACLMTASACLSHWLTVCCSGGPGDLWADQQGVQGDLQQLSG